MEDYADRDKYYPDRDTRHAKKLENVHRHRNMSSHSKDETLKSGRNYMNKELRLAEQTRNKERHLPDHHLVRNPKHAARRLSVDESEKTRRHDVIQHWKDKNKTWVSSRVDEDWKAWRDRTKKWNSPIAIQQRKHDHRTMLHMQDEVLDEQLPEDISEIIKKMTKEVEWPDHTGPHPYYDPEHTSAQLTNPYFV